MDKLFTIAIAFCGASLFSACSTKSDINNNNYTYREDISFRAFCKTNSYELADSANAKVVNEYLDAWCGSCEEDSVLAAINK